MKKLLICLALGALMLPYACEKDDYKKGTGVEEGDGIDLPAAVPGKVAIAYVTYYGTAIPDPSHLTHICYAFAEMYVKNNVYQGFKLQGNESRFKTIVDLKKKNPDLKICISFTNSVSNSDNSADGGFSATVATKESRAKFITDCRNFLVQWGIDGVDLDWEFPGMTFGSNVFDAAHDVDNFTALVKEMREALGQRYSISYAGYVKDKQPTDGGYRYIDVKAVDPYVDFVNIMTYDISCAPQHQSPLEDPSCYWDCKRSLEAYLNAGISASKLVLGIPFYARHSFSESPQIIDFKNLKSLGSGYVIDNWDDAASVPFVTYNGKYYAGYDNPRSIAIKGDWVKANNMKGMMFWDYDGDDSMGTLRTAVWKAVMQ